MKDRYFIVCDNIQKLKVDNQTNFSKINIEFDCLLTCKNYLDKIAWDNSKGWEEYQKATAYLDSGRVKIKSIIIKILFEEQKYVRKRCRNYCLK